VSLFLAEVRVMLKAAVNDPQGLSIQRALRTLGFDGVQDVRAGKLIQVRLEAADAAAAEAAARAMSEQLLANPVIETFDVHLSEVAERVA
jgi:phosphoribosylformylglycinamidine synthase